jgi:hypothetical protein
MARRSYAEFVTDWERLLEAIDANETDLTFLVDLRSQLATVLEGLKASIGQQGDVLSQYRQATRNVESFLGQGHDLSLRLRNGLRMKYGTRAEKLLQFGLQPFRSQDRARVRRENKKAREAKEEKPKPVVQTDSGS